MDKYYIPQHLDAPLKIIIWTIDEFLLFIVPFVILLWAFNAPILGLLTGILLVMALKKIKGEEGHYFLLHLCYWHLPPIIKYKATPPSYVREILG